eukprot:g938.t1
MVLPALLTPALTMTVGVAQIESVMRLFLMIMNNPLMLLFTVLSIIIAPIVLSTEPPPPTFLERLLSDPHVVKALDTVDRDRYLMYVLLEYGIAIFLFLTLLGIAFAVTALYLFYKFVGRGVSGYVKKKGVVKKKNGAGGVDAEAGAANNLKGRKNSPASSRSVSPRSGVSSPRSSPRTVRSRAASPVGPNGPIEEDEENIKWPSVSTVGEALQIPDERPSDDRGGLFTAAELKSLPAVGAATGREDQTRSYDLANRNDALSPQEQDIGIALPQVALPREEQVVEISSTALPGKKSSVDEIVGRLASAKTGSPRNAAKHGNSLHAKHSPLLDHYDEKLLAHPPKKDYWSTRLGSPVNAATSATVRSRLGLSTAKAQLDAAAEAERKVKLLQHVMRHVDHLNSTATRSVAASNVLHKKSDYLSSTFGGLSSSMASTAGGGFPKSMKTRKYGHVASRHADKAEEVRRVGEKRRSIHAEEDAVKPFYTSARGKERQHKATPDVVELAEAEDFLRKLKAKTTRAQPDVPPRVKPYRPGDEVIERKSLHNPENLSATVGSVRSGTRRGLKVRRTGADGATTPISDTPRGDESSARPRSASPNAMELLRRRSHCDAAELGSDHPHALQLVEGTQHDDVLNQTQLTNADLHEQQMLMLDGQLHDVDLNYNSSSKDDHNFLDVLPPAVQERERDRLLKEHAADERMKFDLAADLARKKRKSLDEIEARAVLAEGKNARLQKRVQELEKKIAGAEDRFQTLRYVTTEAKRPSKLRIGGETFETQMKGALELVQIAERMEDGEAAPGPGPGGHVLDPHKMLKILHDLESSYNRMLQKCGDELDQKETEKTKLQKFAKARTRDLQLKIKDLEAASENLTQMPAERYEARLKSLHEKVGSLEDDKKRLEQKWAASEDARKSAASRAPSSASEQFLDAASNPEVTRQILDRVAAKSGEHSHVLESATDRVYRTVLDVESRLQVVIENCVNLSATKEPAELVAHSVNEMLAASKIFRGSLLELKTYREKMVAVLTEAVAGAGKVSSSSGRVADIHTRMAAANAKELNAWIESHLFRKPSKTVSKGSNATGNSLMGQLGQPGGPKNVVELDRMSQWRMKEAQFLLSEQEECLKDAARVRKVLQTRFESFEQRLGEWRVRAATMEGGGVTWTAPAGGLVPAMSSSSVGRLRGAKAGAQQAGVTSRTVSGESGKEDNATESGAAEAGNTTAQKKLPPSNLGSINFASSGRLRVKSGSILSPRAAKATMRRSVGGGAKGILARTMARNESRSKIREMQHKRDSKGNVFKFTTPAATDYGTPAVSEMLADETTEGDFLLIDGTGSEELMPEDSGGEGVLDDDGEDLLAALEVIDEVEDLRAFQASVISENDAGGPELERKQGRAML